METVQAALGGVEPLLRNNTLQAAVVAVAILVLICSGAWYVWERQRPRAHKLQRLLRGKKLYRC